jgi:hypothetical protein
MKRAIAILLIGALAGCDGDAKECPAPMEYQDPALDHIEALDEGWVSMAGAIDRGVTDVAAPQITAPPNEGAVSVSEWAYEWTPPPEARAFPLRRERDDGWDRVGRQLLSFFSFEGIAEAHGSAINGYLYLLEIFIPDQECAVRVVATANRWPVDDETRAKIHGETVVEAQLTSVYEEDTLVLPDDVPARAAERHGVSVTP